MIFVKQNQLASAYLRADQVAEKIHASAYLNALPEKLSGETIVFVKSVDPDLVIKASTSDCKIIYDPIDTFAYTDRHGWKHWYYFIDTVIAYNEGMAEFLITWFKKRVIIPHQWDARITGSVKYDEFTPGYIGYSFNCPSVVPDSGVSMITDPKEMMDGIYKFNCHVSIRDADSLQGKMKPATKVSIAAAVGAIIITTRDASVVELLPKDYPYWCDSISEFPEVLERARNEFKGPVWDRALDMLREVKEKTSIDAIAERYKLL